MAKIINKVADGYQIIPRELIFDSTISDRARFVYCFMASKPEGWDFFLEPMAKEIGYSKDTLRKYINELVDGGWLVRGEQANTNGLFGAVCYELQPTKFTDTEKYRHGKNPTQDNIDIIDNIDKHSMNVDNKEKEIDKSISKKTKKSSYDMSIVPDNCQSLVSEWLEHKEGRREKYTPKSFASFVKRFVMYVDKLGMDFMIERVQNAIANNYQGIFYKNDRNLLNGTQSSNNLPVGMIIHGDRNELYEADKKNLW